MADTTRDSGSGISAFGKASADKRGSESQIDEAIDLVAREMTNLDAPAGMRAEVLARIESAPSRTGFALLPRLATAVSLAVIVLAVAAVLWFARPANRPETVAAINHSSPAQAPRAAKPETRSSETPAHTGLASTTPAGTRTGAATGPAAGGAIPAQPDQNATGAADMGPAALAQPEPIVIAALGPDALQIPAIGVEPIGDLKPITIQDIPVGSTENQSPSIRKFEDEPAPSGLCAEQAH